MSTNTETTLYICIIETLQRQNVTNIRRQFTKKIVRINHFTMETTYQEQMPLLAVILLTLVIGDSFKKDDDSKTDTNN